LNDERVSIFPNPGNGTFMINISQGNRAKILIFGATGQKVYSAQIDEGEHEIRLGENAQGLYEYILEGGPGHFTKANYWLNVRKGQLLLTLPEKIFIYI
jgi:hypothetical protein